jgi:hypothetical protein
MFVSHTSLLKAKVSDDIDKGMELTLYDNPSASVRQLSKQHDSASRMFSRKLRQAMEFMTSHF